MRHDGLKTGLFILSLLLCGAVLPAAAQDSSSPVEVDMSVLDALQPAGEPDPYYQPRTPAARRPILTKEENSSAPASTSAQSYEPPPSSPQPQSYYWPVGQERPATPPETEHPTIVSYPITVKDRSELTDPSLEKAPQASETEEASAPPPASLNPPLPDFKPVITARKATAPLPPRRPEIRQASAAPAQEDKPYKYSLGSAAQSGPPVPAVPAPKVDISPLKGPVLAATPSADDPLVSRLVEPDRETMVKSVAAIVDAMNRKDPAAKAATPVPPEKPVLQKIVAKQVMPRKIMAEKDKAIDLTDISPAAGIEKTARSRIVDITEPVAPQAPVVADLTESPAPKMPEAPKVAKGMVPRTPAEDPENRYEKKYISMAFPQEEESLDDGLTKKVADDILPLLKGNPGWRVQIQAFASNKGKELEGARRTSLSRALSVRSYLLGQGIEARRMDVRALGTQTDRKPADRVDFVFFDPNITP